MECSKPEVPTPIRPEKEEVGVAEVAEGVAREQHLVVLDPLDMPECSSKRAGLAVLPLCMKMMLEKNVGKM